MTEPAPLISIPEAPAPSGAEAQWRVAADGVRLRCVRFPAMGDPRGSVVLSPGRTEPVEKYFEVIGELQARGFVVLAHDWRGQGLSDRLAKDDRLKGHATGWGPFIQDFKGLLDQFETSLPRPWIAVGHSMGGGLTSLALAEGETRFAAAVLSAPMLGIRTGGQNRTVVTLTAALMRLLGKGGDYALPPTDPMADTFETNVLTHDRSRWRRAHAQLVACPDLTLGSVTWGWLDFALSLSARVAASDRIRTLPIPLVIVAAAEEKLVDNHAVKAVADRAPQGRYVLVDGAYHEVLMETDPCRAVFWAEFDRVADTLTPRPV